MPNKAIVTVLGKDRVGIVYGVSKVLAENNVNIEDISQTIMQDYFTMIMLITFDDKKITIDKLQKKLDSVGNELGLKITVQSEDIFKFMHRI